VVVIVLNIIGSEWLPRLMSNSIGAGVILVGMVPMIRWWSAHNKLQPWCPWCRGGPNDSEQVQIPGPSHARDVERV
jgi:hypothetical protein